MGIRTSGSPALRLGASASRLLAYLVPWLGAERSRLGLPRIVISFLVVFAAGMAVVTLVGDQGLLSYWALRTEREQLAAEVSRLEARHRELQRELQALRTDPGYIELLARRDLGLVRPGEVLVQLPESRPEPESSP